MSGIVVKFAEEACYDRSDRFRQKRNTVVFRVVSFGKLNDVRVNQVFTSDYGIFYDPEDEYLLAHLTEMESAVNWGRFVFWRRYDLSGIQIIDPEDDRLVAHIVVNRGAPGIDRGETDWTNVIDLSSRRIERERNGEARNSECDIGESES